MLDTSFLELDDPGTYDVQSDLTLKSNVIILTNEARRKANSSNQTRISEDIILDEELNQIIIKNRAKAYAVGDILVLDDSSWKVTRVSINGTTAILNVIPAELDEVIQGASVSFRLTPDWSKGQFEQDHIYMLQKDARDYFTPSRNSKSQRDMSWSDGAM